MTKLYTRLVRGLQSLCKVSRQSKSKRDTFFSIWDIFLSDESQSFSLARDDLLKYLMVLRRLEYNVSPLRA